MGVLSCTAFCAFSLAECNGMCGDSVRDPGELCDGTDFTLEGQPDTTCPALGYHPPPPGGALPCSAECTPLVQYCGGRCGDGVVNGPEECDGGNYLNPDTAVCPGGSTVGTSCIACMVDLHACYCGNSSCDADEEYGSDFYCPSDCVPSCGNGVCEAGEYPGEPFECEDCSVCGNDVCELGEGPGESRDCPADCP